MRQLKGKVKESRKEKRERKQDNVRSKEQFVTIALPILLVLAAMIVAYIYIKSRPKE